MMKDKKLKTFRLQADILFEAEGIDDAFDRLRDHFGRLAAGDMEDNIFTQGEILIRPFKDSNAPFVSVADAPFLHKKSRRDIQ